MTTSSLRPRDALLAFLIILVWGTNFVVIRIGLNALPPLLFASLRFTFVLLPAVFLLPKPNVSWGNLAGYGLSIGLGQFGLLFIAMNGLISPGLASLVVQTQVFFTVGLSMRRDSERLGSHQVAAFFLAFAGMGVIMAHNGHGATMAGLALTLAAAASWGIANQFAKEASRVPGGINMLAYVVWASIFCVPPLYLLSALREGWPAIAQGLGHASAAIWFVVLWQSIGNTMFGYGCWAWLLARYPAATISPLSLLTPVFGFATASLALGEPLQGWKIVAGLLVLSGLAINLLWRRPRKPVVL